MNSEKLIKDVRKRVNEIKCEHSPTLKNLIELIEQEIEKLKTKLPEGKIRFVAEIENKNKPNCQIKSPESIVDKIKRSKGKYTVDNFSSEMTDLFRDRILCNYLSDIKAIAKALRESEKITQEFEIIEEKDTIYDDRMKTPDKIKGVRSRYLVFKKKNDTLCPKIEIQIMTMLSWAWDKKDHYLIYEPERKGINVSPVGKIKMNAMSELLYVADEFFDSIQQELSYNKEQLL